MKNNEYNVIQLKDYKPSSFLIDSADLQFILNPKETIVKTKLHIKQNQTVKSKNKSIKLDGINLDLQELKLDQKILSPDRYHVTSKDLTILKAPDNFILETTVKIYPEKNLTCMGLYLTNNNFCTQNEPNGFRNITYFIDRPDILTKFTTTIIADKDKYPVLLSNGNLIAQKILANKQHQAVWHDPFPKSAYLFALVAGNFACLEDYYTTNSQRKITLRIFTEPKQLNQCKHAMLSLKQAMEWEEKTFCLEYDLNLYQIVAINDLNFGAMENKGLNIFNSKLLLASPSTATDNDFKRIASVIAHEYFHNWTGNRVTCRDCFQIGLKEGLTTLREQLFIEDLYGYPINRIDTINTMRIKQFAEDAGPLAHPIRLQSYIKVDNFYTYTVYYKSAEIARMLITIFGKKIFQKIIQKFLAKFDGQAITIEDFLQIATTVTKTNLEQFKLWYDQCGTPLLKISDGFDKNKNYILKIKQEHKKAPKDFYIPLVLSLINQRGHSTTTEMLTINKKEQKFSFKGFDSKPIPSLLQNFSAPIKIQYRYNKEKLLFLIQHDQAPINRWEAGQKLMTDIIVELYKKRCAKKSCSLSKELVTLFKIVLSDKKMDPSLAAQILRIPSENYLLEILPNSNIEHLHYTCEFIKLELAKFLEKELLEYYQKNNTKKPYNLKSQSIGKRELKNICLYYLMYLNTPKIFNLCKKQLQHADNLTDACACLVNFANSNYKKREQLLESYYKRWRKEPNLINKWLTINANIKSKGTLKRIKKLLSHPSFNLKNPNNVFSLILTFCENNLINFHATNGEGYKFLANQIILIDKFNPQLAAHITIPLTYAHKLDKKRQKLLQKELVKISKTPKLSPNVYEIIAKSLAKKSYQ